jgi:hypothetical protein
LASEVAHGYSLRRIYLFKQIVIQAHRFRSDDFDRVKMPRAAAAWISGIHAGYLKAVGHSEENGIRKCRY